MEADDSVFQGSMKCTERKAKTQIDKAAHPRYDSPSSFTTGAFRMKTRKKIRDRYVRHKQTDQGRIITSKKAIGKGLRTHISNTDPMSTEFMLGLIFFLEPEQESEQEPFPGGEILTCN